MSDNTYAAELDEQMVCVRCIVGSAQWAATNLGGIWVDSDTKVGIGWTYTDDGWVIPEPEPIVEEQ